MAGLDAERSSPHRFTVRGQEIYLCCPNGLGRSKLTNKYFDSKLNTTSTLRNWKTVLQLTQMADGWHWHPVKPTLRVAHGASLAPCPVATKSLYGVALALAKINPS